MHLLAAQAGTVPDGEAVDLGQTPADMVYLSAADSELACLAAAYDRIGAQAPGLRLTSLLQLGHNLSVDMYVDKVIRGARLVVVRVIGGARYWPYGLEQVAEACRRHKAMLAIIPGDDKPDPDLPPLCTVPPAVAYRLWRYCVEGGLPNACEMLRYAASLLGRDVEWREPAPVPPALLYRPGAASGSVTLNDLRRRWRPGAPVAALVFYRALLQAGNLAVIDALAEALVRHGLNPLPVAVNSLKDEAAAAAVAAAFHAAAPAVILNGTAFAVGKPGAINAPTVLDEPDCPVLQVVFSGGSESAWREGTVGLSSRDIAMNVALPEIDGRILTRAVSFKAEMRRHAPTESWILAYRPVPDRINFVARLAAAWARLRRTPAPERRVALVLANYPNRDGRLANGVGLDAPAGAMVALSAMAAVGYDLTGLPGDSAALIADLSRGPTNDLTALDGREVRETFSVAAYRRFFARLPGPVRQAVTTRWGAPESDPFVKDGAFRLTARRYGNIVVAIQPARGYNIDPASTYHDPALVPPHNYLALYAWVREGFDAHAVIHFGKHGNLEWLPGKSLALSEECFPEVALGPLPHLYPFIVNDPGEGAQAKRRAQAVIIDHLTPPLTRAGTYGPLRELERLVDEYYEAAGLDPRRLPTLKAEILALGAASGLSADCGVSPEDDHQTALAKLDAHLCDLKELQIRDGLHIFGRSPTGAQLDTLLAALVRLPRGSGEGADASLLRALAADLRLAEGFDPLDCDMAAPWSGPRPAVLAGADPWRSNGDTVERLEELALRLISDHAECLSGWTRTGEVLAYVQQTLRPTVAACGGAEIAGLLHGLEGRFVPPGPSGAPTRGKPEVLPTGRNFYSVDTRALPTPAAWMLGWKSACRIIERYAQEHGEYPRVMALSAWGTANMRTGGDDIAQALALMGVRPTWDAGGGRVSGFEILPASILDRPRVDVTLRISGFFRDAFPNLIDLFDAAAGAVAALDEPEDVNPLAAAKRRTYIRLTGEGMDADTAEFQAGARVFGSKPGAYGAGMQALIDEGGWRDTRDLAAAYLTWGGYAYGAGKEGTAAEDAFAERLTGVQAVLHNQDNREHDILDSDDYYQFEGGMAAAVRVLSGGRQPEIYHNDHSRPESPRVRTLKEEIGRVVRSRAVNPKWIAGVMRHGYKGAFEIAATVDYLFGFAAAAACVDDHHFDAVYAAYVLDDEVRGFMADVNPAALREMSAKLLEAMARGLWRPRSNSAHAVLSELA
jgi:cobaltochelatase CobN